MRGSRRLRSQQLRSLGPEIDPLKLSMDWTPEDLEKPQVLVDDVWGDALPGSYHLLRLSEMVCRGVYSNGGKPANFHITDMCDGIVGGKIKKGSVIVIRYVGPKGCGMPEMFYPTEALASSPELHDTTALVTDGRFSGASRGPCVGYVSPEAMEGGPIAIVEKDDLIEIDIPGRGLNLVGVKGKREDNEIMEAIIRERLAKWKKPPEKYWGVLGLYTRLATSAMDGGYMDYGQCQVR